MPEAVAVGDTVTIACYYDLENVNKLFFFFLICAKTKKKKQEKLQRKNEFLIIYGKIIFTFFFCLFYLCSLCKTKAALYSVRWYFELEEFYRYVPKESPPSRVFPISGVSVDVSILKYFPDNIFLLPKN